MKRLRKHIVVVLGATAGSLVAIQGCGKSLPDDCDPVGLCGDAAAADLDTGAVIQPGADGASDAPSWQCCDDSSVPPGSDAPSGATPDASTADATDSADATPQCEDASYCGAGKGCVDTTTSVANCGACGKACTAPTGGTVTCANSACVPACPTGFEACQNQCISVDNLSNCGGCGNVCPGPANGSNGTGTASCVDAGCELSCTSGAHVCGKDCLLNTDPPSTDPCIVSPTYGVFVAPTGSDTSGNGTQAAPYATISKGAAAAKSAGLLDVFACGTFKTSVAIDATMDGRKIYGGFDCSSWSFSASTNTVVAPTSPGIALTVSGLTAGVTFTNFEFDAMAASAPGASSIGVFVASSPVTFVSSKITAGNGAAGTPGGTFSNYSGTAPAPGGSNASGTTGAAGGVNPCLDPNNKTSSLGGTGAAQGGLAQNGSSVPPVGTANGGSSAAASCSAGTVGANGGAVTNGGGTGATSVGSISASGWAMTNGSSGSDGAPAQGGGGGGSNGSLPLGGGGGGAGGCGGGYGVGGQTGGSSISLLIYDASVTLTSSTLTAGNGEQGGNGGPGAPGQLGGAIGEGICNGGVGGVGSGGGGGGGGAGGLSASVYWTGTAPVINGSSVSSAATLAGFTFGTAGTPGLLGSGATAVGGGVGGENGTPGASPPPPAAVIKAP